MKKIKHWPGCHILAIAADFTYCLHSIILSVTVTPRVYKCSQTIWYQLYILWVIDRYINTRLYCVYSKWHENRPPLYCQVVSYILQAKPMMKLLKCAVAIKCSLPAFGKCLLFHIHVSAKHVPCLCIFELMTFKMCLQNLDLHTRNVSFDYLINVFICYLLTISYQHTGKT